MLSPPTGSLITARLKELVQTGANGYSSLLEVRSLSDFAPSEAEDTPNPILITGPYIIELRVVVDGSTPDLQARSHEGVWCGFSLRAIRGLKWLMLSRRLSSTLNLKHQSPGSKRKSSDVLEPTWADGFRKCFPTGPDGAVVGPSFRAHARCRGPDAQSYA